MVFLNVSVCAFAFASPSLRHTPPRLCVFFRLSESQLTSSFWKPTAAGVFFVCCPFNDRSRVRPEFFDVPLLFKCVGFLVWVYFWNHVVDSMVRATMPPLHLSTGIHTMCRPKPSGGVGRCGSKIHTLKHTLTNDDDDDVIVMRLVSVRSDGGIRQQQQHTK